MPSATVAAPGKTRSHLGLLLGFLLICRVILMIAAPHTDTSESRYAEIARKMVETGDWVTLQFDYHVPFWAKPPLSIWMSAAGIKLFGANEFGSRVFIFCGALGVLAMVARLGRREGGRTTGLAAAALLMGMPLFFYCSAAVMTDLALLIGTTMAMEGFRSAVARGSRRDGYWLFLGLAIGLLAKGPLVLVMAGAPIGGWMLLTGNWKKSWQAVPWITGTLLMLALAVPWYLMAEHRTPGFLDYFLVGEHWKRFTVKGWKGDLYGNAHAVAPGMIWVYFLAGTFPWCFGFLALPFSRWRELRRWALADEARGLYLVLWAAWPLVFFTTARNIIPTYPLPALPALALLLAEILVRRPALFWKRPNPLHPLLITACGLMMIGTMAITFVCPDVSPKVSARDLIHRYQRERQPGDRLLYYGPRRYSAEFYSGGSVDHTASIPEIEARLAAPGRLFFVMPDEYMPATLRARFRPIAKSGPETLYVKRAEECPAVPEVDRRGSASNAPTGSITPP